MTKHLTDMDIEKIVGIIDGCTEKLTWDWLCDNAATQINLFLMLALILIWG